MTVKNRDKLFYYIYPWLKYFPFEVGVKLRSLLYPPFFRHWGTNVRIKDGVTIKFPSAIAFGDDLTVNQYCYLDGYGGIEIGKQVMMGAGTKVISASHITDRTDTPMLFQGLRKEPVKVGDDVWLGFDVKLLGNSVVGDKTIVAANAVVTKAFPQSGIVLGGTPAAIIKHREPQTSPDQG